MTLPEPTKELASDRGWDNDMRGSCLGCDGDYYRRKTELMKKKQVMALCVCACMHTILPLDSIAEVTRRAGDLEELVQQETRLYLPSTCTGSFLGN